MNPFRNPVFLLRIAKSYILDVNRIWYCNSKQMKKYQDKALRKIVKYAYTVPLYNKKYKEHGIHPNDIKGVNDIQKLPLITKDDMRESYPNDIIPKGFDKENGFLLSTSGSTGKPIFIYYDMFTAVKYVEGYIRMLKAYGGNWGKSKILLIIDIKPGSVEHAAFANSTVPFIKKFVSMKNIKYLHVGEKIETLIKEINEFKPDFLGSDPNMLKKIAIQKNEGYGKDINPQYLFSSGSILDKYTKKYVEKAFNAKLMDTYGGTESGPLAFESIDGNGYHVNSDFVYLEFLDNEQKPVPYGEPGRLVVTRLYGKGTPIVRYTGMEDMVTPIEAKTSRGMTTEMIKYIGGRSIELIHLPDGRTTAPFHVTTIPASVMDDFKSYKIKQFQIIQHKVDKIEVLIVIDERLRDIGPSVKKISDEIKKRFKQATSPDINIVITEVDEIEKDVRSDYARLIVSKIKHP